MKQVWLLEPEFDLHTSEKSVHQITKSSTSFIVASVLYSGRVVVMYFLKASIELSSSSACITFPPKCLVDTTTQQKQSPEP